MIKQLLPPSLILQPFISATPNTIEVLHFALAVASPAAGTVALVFGACRLGTQIVKLRKGTVSAVLAVKQVTLVGHPSCHAW